jgi:signal transduction histidine kinase
VNPSAKGPGTGGVGAELDHGGDEDGRSDGAPGGWLDRIGSVRVRITVAAALAVALAVAVAGWLLIRSVEDTQAGRIHDAIEDRVDAVASRLSDGADLRSAVAGLAMVRVEDEHGDVLMTNPVTYRYPDGRVQQDFITDESAGSPASGGVGGLGPVPGIPFPDGQGQAEGSLDTVVPGGAADEMTSGSAETGGSAEDGPGGVMVVTRTGSTDVDEVTRRVATARYGDVEVTAFAPVDEVARSVSAVTRALWVLLPVLVGVVALVAWWLVGQALRPVEAIRLEAESIEGSTIHRRLPEPATDDEIGRLARTMNAMLGRLEGSARRQRHFVSDASHELRSPVAAIRSDLEVALHEGDRADWPTVARAVLVEEGRLETLLADLLVLASDDEAESAPRSATTVDMAQLAREEAGRTRRVPVTLDVDDRDADDPDRSDALVVEGVAARLDRALANLVDNAARHADSEVRLTVRRRDDRVRAVVDDDGPGIPMADRGRIFERFARLDDSRARDRGGAGLGLAVVRSIATRHSGFVWAEASPLGGARFILDLPAARAHRG